MSFDVATSEVLDMLRNSIETYEEIIRNVEKSGSGNGDDHLKRKMIMRLVDLKQRAEELAQHLKSMS